MYSSNYDIYSTEIYRNYKTLQELLLQYIDNDKETRLQLLAGFIDTDSCSRIESFYEDV